MVEIKAIKIDGFKNVVNLDLELSGITALLSTNNYGKTNVLTAIAFGIDFIVESEKTKKSMLGFRNGIPQNINNRSTPFSFELTLGFSRGHDESYDVQYGYSFEWASKKTGGRVVEEHFKIRKNGASQKFTTFFKRENNSCGLYCSSVSGRLTKSVSLEDYELMVNKLRSFDGLFYNEILSEINHLDFYLDRNFDSNLLFGNFHLVPKGNSDSFSLDDDSLPHTLHVLEKEHPEKFRLILNAMENLFPFIERLSLGEIKITDEQKKASEAVLPDDAPFEIDNSIYVLGVKTTYFPSLVPFSMMSDGVKRVLILLTKMCMAEIKGLPLIGIEEPENSIHPGLLRSYIQTIGAFLENTKVIISSHSPFIVSNIPLSNVYLGIPNDDCLARFYRLTSSGVDRINKYASEVGTDSGLFIFSVLAGTDEYDLEMLKKCVLKDK